MSFHSLFSLHTKTELRHLYEFSTLFSFAFSLIVIFEPIFLYQQQFPLWFIGVYYALHYCMYIVLLPLGGNFAARFGLEKSIVVSLPLFVFYFITLASIPHYRILVHLAIIFLTLHKIFYWPAFHAMMAQFGDGKNRGTELSWMSFIRYGVGVLGPLIGGVIAEFLGFPILFICTSLLVLASAFPLLKGPYEYGPSSFRYRDPWRVIVAPRYRNVTFTMLGWGENLVDMVYWPLFLFLVLGGTEKLGVYFSIALAVMTGIGFFIGDFTERYSRKRIVQTYLPFMVLGYLFRPLAGGHLRVVLTDTLSRVSFAGVMIPMMYELYGISKRGGALKFGVSLEIVIAITKAITATVLAVVFFFVAPYPAFVVAFVLAAILCLLYAKV